MSGSQSNINQNKIYGDEVKNREGKKYFSYVRVSTEMQVDGYSLEGQENSIKKICGKRGNDLRGDL